MPPEPPLQTAWKRPSPRSRGSAGAWVPPFGTTKTQGTLYWPEGEGDLRLPEDDPGLPEHDVFLPGRAVVQEEAALVLSEADFIPGWREFWPETTGAPTIKQGDLGRTALLMPARLRRHRAARAHVRRDSHRRGDTRARRDQAQEPVPAR